MSPSSGSEEFKNEFKKFREGISGVPDFDGFGLPAEISAYRPKREARMLERTYIQARQVARTLGIKTGTLAKWRRHGRGPKGWIRLGRTSVAYPSDEVEKYIHELENRADPGPRWEKAG